MCFFLAGSGSEFVPGSKVPNYVISLIVWIVYAGIWRFPLLLLPASHLPLLPPPGRHHATMTFKNIFYSVPYGTMQKKDFRLKFSSVLNPNLDWFFLLDLRSWIEVLKMDKELFFTECSFLSQTCSLVNVSLSETN